MDWIKINNHVYYPESCSAQLTIGAHGTIVVVFDIENHPEYKDVLLKMYDSKMMGYIIDTNVYEGFGCQMKTLELNLNKTLVISFHCDVMGIINRQDRRDQRLEDFLNNDTENK